MARDDHSARGFLHMRFNIAVGFLAAFLSLMTACRTAPVADSGFLDESIALRAVPDVEGTSVFLGPNFSSYRRIYIEPVVVRFHPAVAEHDVDPAPMGDLARHLRRALVESLGDFFILAKGPDRGVIHFRVAVTNLYAPGPGAVDLDFPGAVPGVTAVEAKGTDGETGEVVFAARETGWYERLLKAGTSSREEHVKALAKVWARGLNETIDDAWMTTE
jgi:hypothetical protein